MKALEPYSSLEDALSALDNGGRFFNVFSHARDGKITASELKKAEGVISLFAGSFLYFEMMLSRLSSVAKEAVVGALDPELREKYRRTKPLSLAACDLSSVSDSSTAVIVEGVPTFCSEQSKFSCFVTVPVQTGSVTSSIMIPIHEEYSMYSLAGDASEIPIAIHKITLGSRPSRSRLGAFYKMPRPLSLRINRMLRISPRSILCEDSTREFVRWPARVKRSLSARLSTRGG